EASAFPFKYRGRLDRTCHPATGRGTRPPRLPGRISTAEGRRDRLREGWDCPVVRAGWDLHPYRDQQLCDPGEFLCHDHVTCVSQSWLCDGDPDCPDDSDESLDT
uniref:Uncharacterized protein n=1 Tax=Suricata suricatta TaxID=37032 RepID=A0A673SVW8_SURSU